jgi:hypothetical protein
MAEGGAGQALAVTRAVALPDLDAATYARHALHADDRVWVEKNCYVDIWIEVVHALGLDPMAMLPFTVAIDLEDDQWTFFKPVHSELYDLYGLDVQELNVWRPILEHSVTHVAAGKLVSTEADAWWLPDTSGTDYRTQHTKTTIVISDIDPSIRRLGYFHNASYHQLEGEDFTRLFRMEEPHDPAFMPLFAELIRIDRKVARPLPELRQRSRAFLRRHLARRPTTNPVARFATKFVADLPALQAAGLGHYHVWAFANLRQLGAAFELAALHARWLDDPAVAPAAEAFDVISQQAKAFILKAARSVNAKKPLDASPYFDEMASAWSRGVDVLVREVGVEP